MFFDQTLKLSAAQAITSSAPSTNLYDITGAGAGNPHNMVSGGPLLGADLGAGDGCMPTAYFNVETTFTAGGAATLDIAIQSAADDGSDNPDTYTTLASTGPIPVADLIAGKTIALRLPATPTGVPLPRFYRFNYTVATGPMTAGNLSGAILLDVADQKGIQYGNNFVAV